MSGLVLERDLLKNAVLLDQNLGNMRRKLRVGTVLVAIVI